MYGQEPHRIQTKVEQSKKLIRFPFHCLVNLSFVHNEGSARNQKENDDQRHAHGRLPATRRKSQFLPCNCFECSDQRRGHFVYA